MNVYKIIYKSLNKTITMKYSYELNQMIEIMKNNLDNQQNELFIEFMEKLSKEQYNINFEWFARGIDITRHFIMK